MQRVKALGTLTGYAFITERQRMMQGEDREGFIDVHRLFHVASIAWLHGHSEWASCVYTIVDRFQELVPWGGHDGKEMWAPYLLHAVHAAGHKDIVKGIGVASLLDRVSRCQTSLGQYAAAGVSYRQALSFRRDVHGREHPDTLTSINNFAQVLDRQGKYEEAEAMHRQTLAICQKVLEPRYPFTLTSMSNLAGVLKNKGKYEEAEAMHRETLVRREKVLGRGHPDTLISVYCLAYLLASQHCYAESLVLYERACTAQQKVLGTNPPTTRAFRQHYSEAHLRSEQALSTISYIDSRKPPFA
jgi:tetratricopeptide (TPR) repeat protein